MAYPCLAEKIMAAKSKPPSQQAPKPKAPPSRQSAPNPLRQADSRWQRTARYGWDKGGSNGGRK